MDHAALPMGSAEIQMNFVLLKLVANPNSENALKSHRTEHAVVQQAISALAVPLASVAQKLVGAARLLSSVA
jgi:hypothetical protein